MYGDKGEMTCGAACSEHVEMAGTGAGAESAQTHTLQLDVAHSRGLARQVRYDFQEQKKKEYFKLALIKMNIVELSKFLRSRKHPKTPSAIPFPSHSQYLRPLSPLREPVPFPSC